MQYIHGSNVDEKAIEIVKPIGDTIDILCDAYRRASKAEEAYDLGEHFHLDVYSALDLSIDSISETIDKLSETVKKFGWVPLYSDSIRDIVALVRTDLTID